MSNFDWLCRKGIHLKTLTFTVVFQVETRFLLRWICDSSVTPAKTYRVKTRANSSPAQYLSIFIHKCKFEDWPSHASDYTARFFHDNRSTANPQPHNCVELFGSWQCNMLFIHIVKKKKKKKDIIWNMVQLIWLFLLLFLLWMIPIALCWMTAEYRYGSHTDDITLKNKTKGKSNGSGVLSGVPRFTMEFHS